MFERGFYHCEECGWQGNELFYKGFDDRGIERFIGSIKQYDTRVSPPIDRHKNYQGLVYGEGACPSCYTCFDGCIHIEVHDLFQNALLDAREKSV